ncbi:MAG: hypothetical protein EB127_29265, partial [Alphaproteobacteria bacterium]|nr:hypothetical protein [Alphaproteobacteria bacterium]
DKVNIGRGANSQPNAVEPIPYTNYSYKWGVHNRKGSKIEMPLNGHPFDQPYSDWIQMLPEEISSQSSLIEFIYKEDEYPASFLRDLPKYIDTGKLGMHKAVNTLITASAPSPIHDTRADIYDFFSGNGLKELPDWLPTNTNAYIFDFPQTGGKYKVMNNKSYMDWLNTIHNSQQYKEWDESRKIDFEVLYEVAERLNKNVKGHGDHGWEVTSVFTSKGFKSLVGDQAPVANVGGLHNSVSDKLNLTLGDIRKLYVNIPNSAVTNFSPNNSPYTTPASGLYKGLSTLKLPALGRDGTNEEYSFLINRDSQEKDYSDLGIGWVIEIPDAFRYPDENNFMIEFNDRAALVFFRAGEVGTEVSQTNSRLFTRTEYKKNLYTWDTSAMREPVIPKNKDSLPHVVN